MNRGIYPLLSGSSSLEKRLEVITNNISNLNTPGYKRDRLIFKSYLPKPESYDNNNYQDKSYVVINKVSTDLSPGAQKDTGNSLDVSINGDGFFVINTPQGNQYTRNGNFTLNSERELVTQSGMKVMGNGGPITLEEGQVTIDQEGRISVDKNEADSLMIVDFAKPYDIEKVGDNYFKINGESVKPESVNVTQGSLELSNVSPISELTSMIEVTRAYETYQRMIQGLDDITSKSINEIAKV